MKELLDIIKELNFYMIINPVNNEFYIKTSSTYYIWTKIAEESSIFVSKKKAKAIISKIINSRQIIDPEKYPILLEIKGGGDINEIDLKQELNKALIKSQKNKIKNLREKVEHYQILLDKDPSSTYLRSYLSTYKRKFEEAELILANLYI